MTQIILRKSDEIASLEEWERKRTEVNDQIAKVMGTIGDERDRRPLLHELQVMREKLDERILALRRKVA